MKLGKWIGVGLGWSVFGPIGGILGFFVGTFFDEQDFGKVENETTTKTQRGDFIMSMLVLFAAVMKADGRVVKAELTFVQNYLRQNFGREAAQESSIMLRDLLKQEVPLFDVCKQIGRRLDYSSQLQMIHFLFGLAAADGAFHPSEIQVIERIARYMGIREKDFGSIKAMFVKDSDTAYKILGIDKNATLDDIKRAYRQKAKENHPDKVAYLGEDIRKKAEEKFAKINEAYEQIRKERGIA
jgi:DnaJ like chaperone protein